MDGELSICIASVLSLWLCLFQTQQLEQSSSLTRCIANPILESAKAQQAPSRHRRRHRPSPRPPWGPPPPLPLQPARCPVPEESWRMASHWACQVSARTGATTTTAPRTSACARDPNRRPSRRRQARATDVLAPLSLGMRTTLTMQTCASSPAVTGTARLALARHARLVARTWTRMRGGKRLVDQAVSKELDPEISLRK